MDTSVKLIKYVLLLENPHTIFIGIKYRISNLYASSSAAGYLSFYNNKRNTTDKEVSEGYTRVHTHDPHLSRSHL